jgi:histidine phosphotransferase ChpT
MPELALISESVESANYKIQFYRIAFGISSDKQYVAPSEVRRVLAGMYKGSRLRVEWAVETDSLRPMVKLAFLLLMCAEAALPYGGTVRISETKDGWLLCAEGVTKVLDDALWDTLRQADIGVTLTPAQVHFGLAPFAAEDASRTIDPSHDETGVTIRF